MKIFGGGSGVRHTCFLFYLFRTLTFISLLFLFLQLYGSKVSHTFFVYHIISKTHTSSNMIFHPTAPSILNPSLLGIKVHFLVLWLLLDFIFLALILCVSSSFSMCPPLFHALLHPSFLHCLFWSCGGVSVRMRHLFTYVHIIWRKCYSLIPRIAKNTDLDESV